MPVIKQKTLSQLISYLVDHEADIAQGINDFGSLKSVYAAIMKREPEA